MQGYYMTWLYFLLTMQDYIVNGLGRWKSLVPLSKTYISYIYRKIKVLYLDYL